MERWGDETRGWDVAEVGDMFLRAMRDKMCRDMGLVAVPHNRFVAVRAPGAGEWQFQGSCDRERVFFGISHCARSHWRQVTLADSVRCEVSESPLSVCIVGGPMATVGRLLGLAECSDDAAASIVERWKNEFSLMASTNPARVAKVLVGDRVDLAPLDFVLCEALWSDPRLQSSQGPLDLPRESEPPPTKRHRVSATEAAEAARRYPRARMQMEEERITQMWIEQPDDVWSEINNPMPPRGSLSVWTPAAPQNGMGATTRFVPPKAQPLRLSEMEVVLSLPTPTPPPVPPVSLVPDFTPNTPITPVTPQQDSLQQPAVVAPEDPLTAELQWRRWAHGQWFWWRSRALVFAGDATMGDWCFDAFPQRVELLSNQSLDMEAVLPPQQRMEVAPPKARVKFLDINAADIRKSERLVDVDMAAVQLWDKCRLSPVYEGKNLAFVALCLSDVATPTRSALAAISSVWSSHYLGSHVAVADTMGGVIEVKDRSVGGFVKAWERFQALYTGRLTESTRRELVVYIVWPRNASRERLWQLLAQLERGVQSNCVMQLIPEVCVTSPTELTLSQLRELCFAVFAQVRRSAATRSAFLHEPLFLRSHELLNQHYSMHVAFCCSQDGRAVSVVVCDATGELWHAEDAALADGSEQCLVRTLWRVVGQCTPRVGPAWSVFFMDCGQSTQHAHRSVDWLTGRDLKYHESVSLARVMLDHMHYASAQGRMVCPLHASDARLSVGDYGRTQVASSVFRVSNRATSLLVAFVTSNASPALLSRLCAEVALMMPDADRSLPPHIASALDFAHALQSHSCDDDLQ